MKTYFENNEDRVWDILFNIIYCVALILMVSLAVGVGWKFKALHYSWNNPVQVEKVTTREVAFSAVVYRSVDLHIPADGEIITESFTFSLDDSFLDYSDPTWWDRAHDALSAYQDRIDEHNRLDPERAFHTNMVTIPSAEWLSAHTTREYDDPIAYVETSLSTSGDLYEVVSYEDFSRYVDQHEHEKPEIMQRSLVWKDRIYYTTYAKFSRGADNLLFEVYDHLDQPYYIYVDESTNEFLFIKLPSELVNATEEDLLEHEFTVQAVVLQPVEN